MEYKIDGVWLVAGFLSNKKKDNSSTKRELTARTLFVDEPDVSPHSETIKSGDWHRELELSPTLNAGLELRGGVVCLNLEKKSNILKFEVEEAGVRRRKHRENTTQTDHKTRDMRARIKE